MKRIFGAYAYSAGPRDGCWWDQTCKIPNRPSLEGNRHVEVAIIGAGFTGLSAALHVAEAGASVAVLEAQHIGWGASGRNGGFCCLGGGIANIDALEKRFGADGRGDYRRTELAAVDLVSDLIDRLSLDVDRHSEGETELAHRPRDMDDLRERAQTVARDYGVAAELVDRSELESQGLGGPFFGGLHVRAGFGINPRKYVAGLAEASETAGATILENSPVLRLHQSGTKHLLQTAHGAVHADRVIVATNGYSSDDLPRWLSGRYLPSQSNVIVTRPLTDRELSAQGWHSEVASEHVV